GLFISYSHEDAKWLLELQITLQNFPEPQNLEVWDDTKLQASDNWHLEIDNAMARANAAVLLVSRYFLASEFIKNNEIPVLVNAWKRGELKLLWIAVRSSLYKTTVLNDIEAVNNPERPLDSLHPRN